MTSVPVATSFRRGGAADEQPGSQVVRQQRLEPLQGLDIQVVGRLIPDQPAGDLVAGEVVAGQAGATLGPW